MLQLNKQPQQKRHKTWVKEKPKLYGELGTELGLRRRACVNLQIMCVHSTGLMGPWTLTVREASLTFYPVDFCTT